MSKAEKVAFWTWTMVVLVLAGLVFYHSLKTREYVSTQVSFVTSSGWYVEIDSQESVGIRAADSEYFRFNRDDVDLFGVPSPPPLDYESGVYYLLESHITSGKWEVTDGVSVSVSLYAEQPITVQRYPGSGAIAGRAFLVVLAAVLMWLLGLLFASRLSD